MGDRDARIPGFCAKIDRGRNGMGPGPQNPLKKIKISVCRGFRGRGPIFPIFHIIPYIPYIPYNSLCSIYWGYRDPGPCGISARVGSRDRE